MDPIKKIQQEIINDPDNKSYKDLGYAPLFQADERAIINIVGQAPGIKAQEASKIWRDASGETLRSWLGVSEAQFFDSGKFALLPMDFYYPGKGKSGDKAPRKGFAEKWHPQLLALMPNIKLTILTGLSAQKYYLQKRIQANLTETVRHAEDYLPDFFPIVHPSPLNFRWHLKNPWFKAELVPILQALVKKLL